MKKLLILFLTLFLCFPQVAFANGAGLPPFFKINEKLSISNPLQLYGITAQSFLIPQDFAPENYVINQPINFEIDESQLVSVIDQQYLKNTKFSWDFGDGNEAEGLQNKHTYTKIGSYILVLTINIYTAQDQTPTQFIDSFLLNILPNKNFTQLPQAVITMNGLQIKDPLNNRFSANFKNPISFNAIQSKASGSHIIQYLWDFGDGQTSNQKIVNHTYDQLYPSVTVVLRVKDSNGYISDAFAGINNDPKIINDRISQTSTQSKNSGFNLLLLVIFIVAVLIIVSFAIKFILTKRRMV